MQSVVLRHTLRTLVEPAVERLGFELVAVEWLNGRRGPILRLSIDRTDGVNAEHCAAVSATVSPILDEADPVSGAYHLEVSSPGIDRPVQRAEDFERFLGYRIKLRLVEGHPRRRYTGILQAFDDGEITLVVDGQPHTLTLDSVERANLVLDLTEYQALAQGAVQ